MPEVPRLPDGLKGTLPEAILMFLVVIFVQLAKNVVQWGRAAGFVKFAFKGLRGIGHDVGQV